MNFSNFTDPKNHPFYFIFAVILLLGAWKFGVEGLME